MDEWFHAPTHPSPVHLASPYAWVWAESRDDYPWRGDVGMAACHMWLQEPLFLYANIGVAS